MRASRDGTSRFVRLRDSSSLLLILVSNICTILAVKRCPRCGETKPLSEFHKASLRRDGVQSVCKSCRADIDHARYELMVGRAVGRHPQRAVERGLGPWLANLKVGRPCTDCGRVFPPQVMQWDHRPGFEKLGELSNFWGRSREEILNELAKCDLVCTNCHGIRTFTRNRWGAAWIREESPIYEFQWAVIGGSN